MALLSRDATYLDPPEVEACHRCEDRHPGDQDDDDEPERCSCRCHWDAVDYEIEALNAAGYDV